MIQGILNFITHNPMATGISTLAGAGARFIANKLAFSKPISNLKGPLVGGIDPKHSSSGKILAGRVARPSSSTPRMPQLPQVRLLQPLPKVARPPNLKPGPRVVWHDWNEFETALKSSVDKGFLDADVRFDIQKKASVFQTPFNFYKYVHKKVFAREITPTTAFFLFRGYDKGRGLDTTVSTKMSSFLHQKKITGKEAYTAYQTYKTVLGGQDDLPIYNSVLQKIYSNEKHRIPNLLAYQSARWISNQDPVVKPKTERSRFLAKKMDLPKSSLSSSSASSEKTQVWNMTTFAATQALVKEGFSPLVLNMANEEHPGGGFIKGSTAQEECLCRQSNLYEILEHARAHGFYPMSESEVILSPQITFFRDDAHKRVQPFQADVVSSAAYICGGRLQATRPQSDADYEKGTKNKMRSVFRTAIQNGNNAIVLGAFGCGAFGNDPRTISGWYRDVMNEAEFRGRLPKIVFAIIDDRNGSGNFKAFEHTFR